ncbi:hypothetical protein [Candidatus Odyssella thessalonicensis]|uniref:hypothetical protein n=1 Tax=Candidatus Odyssella thessalonicensis TaxID=84647 RepID=UPI000225AC5E|nr:hypothetical protein [Candidatus Odyssella thessalonicensis]
MLKLDRCLNKLTHIFLVTLLIVTTDCSHAGEVENKNLRITDKVLSSDFIIGDSTIIEALPVTPHLILSSPQLMDSEVKNDLKLEDVDWVLLDATIVATSQVGGKVEELTLQEEFLIKKSSQWMRRNASNNTGHLISVPTVKHYESASSLAKELAALQPQASGFLGTEELDLETYKNLDVSSENRSLDQIIQAEKLSSDRHLQLSSENDVWSYRSLLAALSAADLPSLSLRTGTYMLVHCGVRWYLKPQSLVFNILLWLITDPLGKLAYNKLLDGIFTSRLQSPQTTLQSC